MTAPVTVLTTMPRESHPRRSKARRCFLSDYPIRLNASKSEGQLSFLAEVA
jgi:hypothetical protein